MVEKVNKKNIDVGAIEASVAAIQDILLPLQKGEFRDLIYKTSIYIESVAKVSRIYQTTLNSIDSKSHQSSEDIQAMRDKAKKSQVSIKNSLRFARINLDAAMTGALGILIWRPKNTSKHDEKRRAEALKKSFDCSSKPIEAMVKHYRFASDPWDKFLIFGPWGHDYLKKRTQNLETFDGILCEIIQNCDSTARMIVLKHNGLSQAIDRLEEDALRLLSD